MNNNNNNKEFDSALQSDQKYSNAALPINNPLNKNEDIIDQKDYSSKKTMKDKLNVQRVKLVGRKNLFGSFRPRS